MVPHSHPYQARALPTVGSSVGIAGASTITIRAILTAVHNIDHASSCQVVLGAHQLLAVEPSQQRFNVSRTSFRMHAQYNRDTLENDIAIMILPQAAALNFFVQLIALPTLGTTDAFAGEVATVTGWGMTETGRASTHLRYTRNLVISNAVCRAMLGNMVVNSTICTYFLDRASSACIGDSGGPLTVVSRGQRIQIGIVSFGSGSGNCVDGSPTGYARITSFRQWIDDNMNP